MHLGKRNPLLRQLLNTLKRKAMLTLRMLTISQGMNMKIRSSAPLMILKSWLSRFKIRKRKTWKWTIWGDKYSNTGVYIKVKSHSQIVTYHRSVIKRNLTIMKSILQNIKIRLIQINTLQYKNRAIKFVSKFNPLSTKVIICTKCSYQIIR